MRNWFARFLAAVERIADRMDREGQPSALSVNVGRVAASLDSFASIYGESAPERIENLFDYDGLIATCPTCDSKRSVIVRECYSFEVGVKDVWRSPRPTGYCVLCPFCSTRYEVSANGSKQLSTDAKPQTKGPASKGKAADMLADFAVQPGED